MSLVVKTLQKTSEVEVEEFEVGAVIEVLDRPFGWGVLVPLILGP